VAWRLLVKYCGVELPDAKLHGSKLSESAIRTVCDFIEEHLCTPITLEDLAALVYLSPFHFARCFKATMGLAPYQYIIARRMELAKRLALTTTLNVSEIAWSIGYENISHFRRLFAMHFGVTPGVIRRAAGIQTTRITARIDLPNVNNLGIMHMHLETSIRSCCQTHQGESHTKSNFERRHVYRVRSVGCWAAGHPGLRWSSSNSN